MKRAYFLFWETSQIMFQSSWSILRNDKVKTEKGKGGISSFSVISCLGKENVNVIHNLECPHG